MNTCTAVTVKAISYPVTKTQGKHGSTGQDGTQYSLIFVMLQEHQTTYKQCIV